MSTKSLFPAGRAELKYYFPNDITSDIREFIQKFAKLDSYAEEAHNGSYTVRSIYLDTDDFNFYYEKKDGVKIRKKLRLRSYNHFSHDCISFLEIKRRYNNRIVKERVSMPLDLAEFIHKECKTPDTMQDISITNKSVIEKYIYNISRLNLRSTVLVSYEREAYFSNIDTHERVTIDKNVRSYIFPELCDLFREDDLKNVTNGNSILELKFDGYMPKWMGRLVHEFRLRPESISKYCLGLEMWYDKQ